VNPWKDDAYEDLDPEEKPRRRKRRLGNENEEKEDA
jgi:hypothetical protein